MLGKTRIGNICYNVSDIERTEKFYRNAIGLTVQNMGDDGSGNDWLLASTAGNLDLLFFKTESRAGNSPIIVFDLEDGGIDTIISALEDKGVVIASPVSLAPGGWSAEVLDPDGHTISMYQAEDKPREA